MKEPLQGVNPNELGIAQRSFDLVPDPEMRFFLEKMNLNFPKSDTYSGSDVKKTILKTLNDLDPDTAHWPSIFSASEKIVAGRIITHTLSAGSRNTGRKYNLDEALLYSAAIKLYLDRYNLQPIIVWNKFEEDLSKMMGEDPAINHLQPSYKHSL